MVYTEVKEKNQNKYYYRVLSTRKGKKTAKNRIYLGANLKKSQLLEKEKQADRELRLLTTLLKEDELRELKKIKKEWLKLPRETAQNRYEAFTSLFTYDSTNIEGNTLTLQETAQLLFENIAPRKSLREINEVLNHKQAFDFILNEKRDISKDLVLKLHKIVVKNTLKPTLNNQIGKYRTLQVYIRGASWLPPKPEEIPKEMSALFSWYSKNKNKLHPLILAAYFHSAFETIHPFIDGNGRVGRLLINLILSKNKYPMINIPNKKKHLYYEALEMSQIKGELRPLIKFLFGLISKEQVRF